VFLVSGMNLNKFFDVGVDDEPPVEEKIETAAEAPLDLAPVEDPTISKTETVADPLPTICNYSISRGSEIKELLRLIATTIDEDETLNKIRIKKISLCETADVWKCEWVDKGKLRSSDLSGHVPVSVKNTIDLVDMTNHYIRDIAHPRDRVYLFWGWSVSPSKKISLWYDRLDLDELGESDG